MEGSVLGVVQEKGGAVPAGAWRAAVRAVGSPAAGVTAGAAISVHLLTACGPGGGPPHCLKCANLDQHLGSMV